jgi:hypothetical protein
MEGKVERLGSMGPGRLVEELRESYGIEALDTCGKYARDGWIDRRRIGVFLLFCSWVWKEG